MSDRITAIRDRLRAVRPPVAVDAPGGAIIATPGTLTFLEHAPGDVAFLLAQLDERAECGCPIARVRMHTDECRSSWA